MKLPPICRSQLPVTAPAARFTRVMWGSMVVLVPRSGVARDAATALASTLDGVRFAVAERSLSADTDRPSAQAEAEAIARQLARGERPGRMLIVGQGDGAQVAVELARRLEGTGRAATRVCAVVVAEAAAPPRDGSPDPEPISAPIHVWAGSGDPFAPPGQEMLGWSEHTEALTTFRAFDGSAGFLLTRAREVAWQLRRVLEAPVEAEVLDAR